MANNKLNHCMRDSMQGLPLTDFDFDKSINNIKQYHKNMSPYATYY